MTALAGDDARLQYLASGTPARPHRLLVLSHGVGGNETVLASFAMMAARDTVVVRTRAPVVL